MPDHAGKSSTVASLATVANLVGENLRAKTAQLCAQKTKFVEQTQDNASARRSLREMQVPTHN
jgi:hypothetical protein